MRRRCSAVVVLVLAVAAVRASPASAQRGSSAADEPAYTTPVLVQTALDVDLTIDYDRPAVNGTAALTLVNRGKRPVREVQLLLNRLMSIREVRDAAGRRLPVRTSVSLFEDEPLRQVVYARVALPRPIAPGQAVTLTTVFGGALAGYVEAGNLYVKDRIDRRFTILREDALAFPRVGVPSARANLLCGREEFRFRARVTVPDGQVVAAGGQMVGRHASNGRTTFEFAGASVPFLNIAIAPYRLVEKQGIQVYALPDDEPKATAVVDAAQQTLARLESWYGPLGTAPRITIIEIPDGFGSQASLTAGIILEAVVFRDRSRLIDLYHELTHLWNPADLDAPSPRWNEGLAMYLEYRLAKDLDGFAGTADVMERARKRVCDASVVPVLRGTPFAQYGRADLTDYSYRVGMLMFAALDAIVGPAILDAGVRGHVQAHLAGGGTTQQLVESLTQAAAPADLGGFFRDWMFTTGWVDRVCSARSFADAVETWRTTTR